MSPSAQAVVVAVSLVAAMTAYALFAGADFGGGMWELVAGRGEAGEHRRRLVRRSTTPVWEANNVWIVFGLVASWTAFPTAFAAAMRALLVPLALALLGTVLRALGFAFRGELERRRTGPLTALLFSGSALLPPFFLGTVVGAVATGEVRLGADGNVLDAWTGRVPLVTGVLFAAMCLFVGATYLVGDCTRRGEVAAATWFSRRVAASGAVTGALAALDLALLRWDGGYVWHRLLHDAWPLALLSVLGGVAATGIALRGGPAARRWGLRPAAAAAVVGVIAAWAWAQYPYAFPTSLPLRTAAADTTTLDVQIVVLVVAVVLVLPSFALLYALQQRDDLDDVVPTAALRELEAQRRPVSTVPPPAARRSGSRLEAAAVLGVLAAGALRARRSR